MRSIIIFTDKSLTLKWLLGENKNFVHQSMRTDFWSIMLSIFSPTEPKYTLVDLAHDIPRPYAKKCVEYELNHFSINSACGFIPSFGELDLWFVHRFFSPHTKQNLRRREFCNFRQSSVEKTNCLTNAVFSQDLGTCKRFPSAFWTKSIPARDGPQWYALLLSCSKVKWFSRAQLDFQTFGAYWFHVWSTFLGRVVTRDIAWGFAEAEQDKATKTTMDSTALRWNISFVKTTATWCFIRMYVIRIKWSRFTCSNKQSKTRLCAFLWSAFGWGFVLSWTFGSLPHCLRTWQSWGRTRSMEWNTPLSECEWDKLTPLAFVTFKVLHGWFTG